MLAFAIQDDGKIIVGGNFDGYNGVNRPAIARVNPDGSLDESFKPGAGAQQSTATGDVSAIAVRGNSIIIGGFFTTYDGVSRNDRAGQRGRFTRRCVQPGHSDE